MSEPRSAAELRQELHRHADTLNEWQLCAAVLYARYGNTPSWDAIDQLLRSVTREEGR
jgi:hypothetical protein